MDYPSQTTNDAILPCIVIVLRTTLWWLHIVLCWYSKSNHEILTNSLFGVEERIQYPFCINMTSTQMLYGRTVTIYFQVSQCYESWYFVMARLGWVALRRLAKPLPRGVKLRWNRIPLPKHRQWQWDWRMVQVLWILDRVLDSYRVSQLLTLRLRPQSICHLVTT